ncbi:MAG: hypothetical protein M1415_10765 [Firmicutes bacterium]|nr:hypothetical protein [Bacillota bacterium]
MFHHSANAKPSSKTVRASSHDSIERCQDQWATEQGLTALQNDYPHFEQRLQRRDTVLGLPSL